MVMRGPLSPERIDEIEEQLIRADLGVDVAARIAKVMGEGRYHNLAEVQTGARRRGREDHGAGGEAAAIGAAQSRS